MNCGSRQIVVCMTGFTQNPKLQQYRKAISELGCKLIEQLAQGTDILLVDNTCTEKYKVHEKIMKDRKIKKKYDLMSDYKMVRRFCEGGQTITNILTVPVTFYFLWN